MPTPIPNLSGLPLVTRQQIDNGDPAILNNALRLLATQITSVQNTLASAGIGKSSSGSSSAPSSSGSSGGWSSSSGGGGGSSSGPSGTTITIQGTHLQRLGTYLAPSQPVGCYYYETDRATTYLNYASLSTVQVWQWQSGTMFDVIANRPADLVSTDTGFQFFATDLFLFYRWTRIQIHTIICQ